MISIFNNYDSQANFSESADSDAAAADEFSSILAALVSPEAMPAAVNPPASPESNATESNEPDNLRPDITGPAETVRKIPNAPLPLKPGTAAQLPPTSTDSVGDRIIESLAEFPSGPRRPVEISDPIQPNSRVQPDSEVRQGRLQEQLPQNNPDRGRYLSGSFGTISPDRTNIGSPPAQPVSPDRMDFGRPPAQPVSPDRTNIGSPPAQPVSPDRMDLDSSPAQPISPGDAELPIRFSADQPQEVSNEPAEPIEMISSGGGQADTEAAAAGLRSVFFTPEVFEKEMFRLKFKSEITEIQPVPTFEKILGAPAGDARIKQTATALPAAETGILEQIEAKLQSERLIFSGTSEKTNTLKLRLRPAELGTIEIRLEKSEAGRLRAHFQTQNEASQHILLERFDELRNALQNVGWQIEKLDVSCNSSFSAGSRDGNARQTETTASEAVQTENSAEVSVSENDSLSIRLVNLRA